MHTKKHSQRELVYCFAAEIQFLNCRNQVAALLLFELI
jgi:hypothetical protein